MQVLRTYVLQCVQYALEVITLRAPDELAIVTEIDAFLEIALLLAAGVPLGAHAWSTRRCVKAAVIWHDTGVLRMLSQIELAHLRVDAKCMPTLRPAGLGSSDVDAAPAPRRMGLTAHIRASLPPAHAWRALVLRAQQCLDPAPCPAGSASEASRHRRLGTDASSNADRALRARNANAQRSLASVRVGRSAASQLPTRRSARCPRANKHCRLTWTCSLVFQECSDNCLPRALHREFTAEIALPLIALRSGHLLDEHASPCCDPAPLQVPTRGSSAVRAAAASAPPSKPAAARQTRLRYAKRSAPAAPYSKASTSTGPVRRPERASTPVLATQAADRYSRCARRFAAQTDCADAHVLPWLRVWHVFVTCKRVLPHHLRHLGGFHSFIRLRGMLH